jgi:hypothetical protein
MRYEGYRERSLRSLSQKEFTFVIKALLYEAKPEEGD